MNEETLKALQFLDEQTARIPADRATHQSIVSAIKHIERELVEGAKARSMLEALQKADSAIKKNGVAPTKPSMQ